VFNYIELMTLRMYGLWHQQFECQTCFDQSESNLGLSVTCFFSIHELSTSEMCEECRLTQKNRVLTMTI